MNFGQSISTCMSKYVTFSGRASRSEYWWFVLFNMLAVYGAMFIGGMLFGAAGDDAVSGILAGALLGNLVSLALALPSFAAMVRRLHDTGRSGWWWLIVLTIIGAIVLIVWLASEGSDTANEYGEPVA